MFRWKFLKSQPHVNDRASINDEKSGTPDQQLKEDIWKQIINCYTQFFNQ